MACYVFYQFHAQPLVHKCYNFDCHGDGVHCLITLWGLSQDLLEIYDETNDMPKATPNYVASIPPPPITVVSHKYAPPPFATSVQNAGEGFCAGCDNFSSDYTLPYGKA